MNDNEPPPPFAIADTDEIAKMIAERFPTRSGMQDTLGIILDNLHLRLQRLENSAGAETPPSKINLVVQPKHISHEFVRLMDDEIERNEMKKGLWSAWNQGTPVDWAQPIREHVTALLDAIRDNPPCKARGALIRRHTAAIANYAMKGFEIFRQ